MFDTHTFHDTAEHAAGVDLAGAAIAATTNGDANRELFRIAALTPDATLAALQASPYGLFAAQVAERLHIYGPNLIAAERRHGILRQFLVRLVSPLPVLLMALAAAEYSIGQAWNGFLIAAMVLLSALLPFIQEYRSTQAAARLQAMAATTVTVLRRKTFADEHIPDPDLPRDFGLHRIDVPFAAIVPGEIIYLAAGDIVPADVRLLSAADLFVSQTALTGNDAPVKKCAQPSTANVTSALELNNVAFMGANVISGSACAVVIATGAHTTFGHIAAAIVGQRRASGFDLGIDQVGRLILRAMLIMVPVLAVLNGLTKGDWLEALLFAVAAAAGLTPEMLPSIVKRHQAKGALALFDKKIIIKRLQATPNFGAMDVLCIDCTGILTQDRVILEKHVDIFGKDTKKVLDYAYLHSFHQTGIKNLLDVALLQHTDVHRKIKADTEFVKVDEIPFDFQRRRRSVVVAKRDGSRILICKGALDTMQGVCTRAERNGDLIALEGHHHQTVAKVAQALGEEGLRVTAIAYRQLPANKTGCSVADESSMVLVGYIAFLDPPKDSAFAALQALDTYGVAVKVFCADDASVTRTVCRQVGLATDQLVLGSDIDAMSDELLAVQSDRARIFAQLKPQQKARVVHALQRQGRVVGYLGNGIDDGPALKTADVGIAAANAVGIAKDAADIILLDNNLALLKDGIIVARTVLANIAKQINLRAGANFGNLLSALAAACFLPLLPMLPVQMLVYHFLYAASQTTLATVRVEDADLLQPHRWDSDGCNRFLLFTGPLRLVFDGITLSVLWYLFHAGHNPPLFHSGWFVASLLAQTFIVHIVRTGAIPFIQSKHSVPLLVSTIAVALLGGWLPTSPFAAALGMAALPPAYWAALAVIVGAYLGASEWLKPWLVRRFGFA